MKAPVNAAGSPDQAEVGSMKRRNLLRFGAAATVSTGAFALTAFTAAPSEAASGPDSPANYFSTVNVVVDYGAKGDGKSVTTGAISSGQSSLTASGADFSLSDVGKAITVRGAGASGAALTTTISGFTDSTNITLAANASNTVSGAAVSWGTDDTLAFQKALNYAGPQGLPVFIPKPSSHYVLTAALNLYAWCGLGVRGDNWETTEIRQYSDDTPIFRWPVDNTHSQTFESLRLTWANPQTYRIGPSSVAFARDNTDGVSSLCGHFHHAFRDLKIIGATYGFKVLRSFDGDAMSTNPWWGCEWTRIFFSNINRSCINLNLGTVGAPCNRFDQIKIFQNATFPNDGAEAAFVLRGEAVMSAIDVEMWRNQVLNMPSGNYLTIRGLHVEHHNVLDSLGGNRVVYVANVPVDISSYFVSYDSRDNFAKYAIYADINSHVTVNGAYLYSPPGGASYLFATSNAANSAKLSAKAVNVQGFGKGIGLWTNGSSVISNIYEIEGQAPVLQSSDALPTAAVGYRGRRYTQLGNGTTTADQTVVCLLSASGTYSWKTAVGG